MRVMTFICPLCGASGQRFPLRFAGRRQAKMSCRRCRVELRSDPRLGTFFSQCEIARAVGLAAVSISRRDLDRAKIVLQNGLQMVLSI